MDKAKKILKEKGISPSLQRVFILHYLLGIKTHPSAEEVYEALIREMTTLSKTTVYNTLKLFADKGIIRPISVIRNELHYETNLDFHSHFKCKKCDRIFDVMIDNLDFDIKEIDGHIVEEVELILQGICRDCREE